MPETSPSESLIAGQTRKLLQRLALQVEATLHSRTPDSVHDLRVAIRRFGQVLILFKPCFAARERRRVRRRLKEVMSYAGEVRDRDIAISLLAKVRSPEAAALEIRIRDQRKLAEEALVAALRHWDARKIFAQWRAVLLPPAAPDGEPERPLIRLAEKFFRSGDRAAAARSSGQDLHRFRIQSKKFRYSIELFRPVYGKAAEEWLSKIKQVQTLLGEMNDYRITRDLVRKLGAGAPLAASFKHKQQTKAAQFRRLWNEQYSASGRGCFDLARAV
jgi:CHAD domain-containing protein